MGRIMQNGDERKGVGATVALQLANQAIAVLHSILEHLGVLIHYVQDRPNLFRAQAGVHRSFSGGASFSAGEVVKVADANPHRKGLDVRVTGADTVMLALGVQAITDPGANAAGYGLPLAPQNSPGTTPVGVWDGRISGVVWTGELWATVAAPGRFNFELYVTEV